MLIDFIKKCWTQKDKSLLKESSICPAGQSNSDIVACYNKKIIGHQLNTNFKITKTLLMNCFNGKILNLYNNEQDSALPYLKL